MLTVRTFVTKSVTYVCESVQKVWCYCAIKSSCRHWHFVFALTEGWACDLWRWSRHYWSTSPNHTTCKTLHTYDAAYGVYDWQALRQIGTRSNIWWRSTEAVHTERMGWFPSAAPSEIGSTKKHIGFWDVVHSPRGKCSGMQAPEEEEPVIVIWLFVFTYEDASHCLCSNSHGRLYNILCMYVCVCTYVCGHCLMLVHIYTYTQNINYTHTVYKESPNAPTPRQYAYSLFNINNDKQKTIHCQS